jgi:integrase
MTEPPKRAKARGQKKRRVAPGLWQLNTDLYEIRVRGICPRTGKMSSRWRMFEGSRTEAFAERERLQEALRGERIETRTRETLAAFAHSWLSTRLARGDWRETTARRYAESLDLHILPRLGGVFVDALTPRDVERAIAEWAKEYARATVNSWLRVMRTLLGSALAQGLIVSNPAASVRALRERGEDVGDEDDWANALAPSELDAYLRSWRELYLDHIALIATLVLTGLRWGEATSLTWTDVEAAEQNNVLRVRRSHVRAIVRNTTKTGKRRIVPFPAELASLLGEHRRPVACGAASGLLKGWVFPNAVGKPRANGSLSERIDSCSLTRRSPSASRSTACGALPPTCCGARRSTRSLPKRSSGTPPIACGSTTRR